MEDEQRRELIEIAIENLRKLAKAEVKRYEILDHTGKQTYRIIFETDERI